MVHDVKIYRYSEGYMAGYVRAECSCGWHSGKFYETNSLQLTLANDALVNHKFKQSESDNELLN